MGLIPPRYLQSNALSQISIGESYHFTTTIDRTQGLVSLDLALEGRRAFAEDNAGQYTHTHTHTHTRSAYIPRLELKFLTLPVIESGPQALKAECGGYIYFAINRLCKMIQIPITLQLGNFAAS